mmetsp:Transcript_9993/g.18181  ORF Transcript_9993/g.18181 Transcript_9993/m.18181 type:complete len:442 (-) Transcript_9993:47-1372(-)
MSTHGGKERKGFGEERQYGGYRKKTREPGPIRFRTTFRNCILDALKRRGWKEVEDESQADINWMDREYMRERFDKVHLDSYQKVNHFRNHYELTRKDMMVKNLKRIKRQLEKEGKSEEAAQFDFFPQTFVVPHEYLLFVEAFKKLGGTWIMKPVGKSQGKGIFLVDKLSQLSGWKTTAMNDPNDVKEKAENYVVQQYIHNPLLIGGRKFDIRLYVLVKSYNPLVVYIYRDGFARFSVVRYDMNNINNTFVHVTNVAVQKTAADYDKDTGGKMFLRPLKIYLISKYGYERANELFCEIQLVVIRSLLSVQKVIINDKHCFELYGYDVMIDENLKVWLIEVNAFPSLTANTKDDYNLKCDMLEDMLSIIDLEHRLNGDEDQVGGFDLIYNEGYVKFDRNCMFTSYLGCKTDRVAQISGLFRSRRKEREKARRQQLAQTQQNKQ